LTSLHVCCYYNTGVPYSQITVGVPREIFPNERRVALTPQNAALLYKKGFAKVLVERGAGAEAQFLDEQYAASGATLVSREDLYAHTDVMLKVRPPAHDEEALHIKPGSTLLSFLYPSQNKAVVEALAKRNINAFAMDMIPRLSRSQVFDALSSMANIAGMLGQFNLFALHIAHNRIGYKAVLEASNHFGRFLTGMFLKKMKENKMQCSNQWLHDC
jgi:H+-translocating NAD(P) transhydrogenase